MNVTSVLSNGYLDPAWRPVAPEPPRPEPSQQSRSLAAQERSVLQQEQALRARAGSGAEVHTTYRYSIGPDGRSYITGASVSLSGDEQTLAAAGPGVVTRREELHPEAPEPADGKSSRQKEKQGRTEGPQERKEASSRAQEDARQREIQAVAQQMAQREREVIAHEMAHQAAAGQFGGGATYTRAQGPDGRSYIVGGEVPIHFVEGATPEETVRNMEQIQRAATAPADPSPQDLRVAAKAAAAAARARAQIAQEQSGKNRETNPIAAKGTPVRPDEPEKEDPAKNGAGSVVASVRFSEIQRRSEAGLRAA